MFLESLARSGIVTQACDECGMSPRAAYTLRLRADGIGFHLGWNAAILIARDRLVDTLMARAINGWEEIITRFAEGSDERSAHRIDNRLAMSLLGRLDKRADVPLTEGTDAVLARIIAQDFEAYLDLIESGATGAAIGLFLALRTPRSEATSAPRNGGIGHSELCSSDQTAPAADTPPQSPEEARQSAAEKQAAQLSVWCLKDHDPNDIESWRCEFPPPSDFYGDESAAWDEYDEDSIDYYTRDLTEAEFNVVIAQRKARRAPFLNAAIAARDAYFGFEGGDAVG
jgi:hypothetical protein